MSSCPPFGAANVKRLRGRHKGYRHNAFLQKSGWRETLPLPYDIWRLRDYLTLPLCYYHKRSLQWWSNCSMSVYILSLILGCQFENFGKAGSMLMVSFDSLLANVFKDECLDPSSNLRVKYLLHNISFRQNARMAFLPIAVTSFCCRSSVFVHHKLSCSYTSRTVWPRFTKIYMDMHTDPVCSLTGYDVTGYVQAAIKKFNWMLHETG